MKKLLKNLIYAGMGVLIVAGAVLLFSLSYRPEVCADNINKNNLKSSENIVVVEGKGIVRAEPDIAYLNLTVSNIDKDVKKSQEDNAKKMEKLYKSLKTLGIDKKDIQTSNYNINEEYDWTNKQRVFEGYRVVHSIKITIRDIAKAGEVLDKSISAGASIANGISFDIKDRDKLYNEALKFAMDSAEEKAIALMGTFDKKPSSPSKVTEMIGYNPDFKIEYNMNYRAESSADEASDTAVHGGSLMVTATVKVEYKY